METTDYQKQATDFLDKTGAAISITFSRLGKHFPDDKEDRDIYTCKLSKNGRVYSFDFGNSIAHSGKCFVILGGKKMLFESNKIDRKLIDKYNIHPSEIRSNPDFEEPTAYDILACLQKYDVGTFENFCDEFGYSDQPLTQYDKVKTLYEAVSNEYMQLCRLFSNEEIELMQEIN